MKYRGILISFEGKKYYDQFEDKKHNLFLQKPTKLLAFEEMIILNTKKEAQWHDNRRQDHFFFYRGECNNSCWTAQALQDDLDRIETQVRNRKSPNAMTYGPVGDVNCTVSVAFIPTLQQHTCLGLPMAVDLDLTAIVQDGRENATDVYHDLRPFSPPRHIPALIWIWFVQSVLVPIVTYGCELYGILQHV